MQRSFMSTMKKIIRLIVAPAYWAIRNYYKDHMVESYSVAFKAKIGKKVVVRSGSEVGPNVCIGDYSYISGPRAYVESAVIGKFCSIARATTIGVSDHNHQLVTTHPIILDPLYGFVDRVIPELQKHPPIIGNDVWIGMGSFIMRGVTIGDGAVVAANSVVTKNVNPYSIVAGSPAKHIKYRFDAKTISAMSRIKWWDWERSKIFTELDDFNNVEYFILKHDEK